jgi:hypothetical protein
MGLIYQARARLLEEAAGKVSPPSPGEMPCKPV